MNVLNYINSRDIREYLKNIGYCFDSAEIAWLIWRCNNIGIKDKVVGWRELMDSRSDCVVTDDKASLFSILNDMIQTTDEILNMLCSEDYEGEYSCDYGENVYISEALGAEFDSFGDCMNYIMKNKHLTREFVITKSLADMPQTKIKANISCNGEIMNVEFAGDCQLVDKYTGLCDSFSDIIDTYFPLPFKAGDIVSRCGDEIPFVISSVSFSQKTCAMLDITPFEGYSFSEDAGEMFDEYVSNYEYMDIEFYRGCHNRNFDVLCAVSKFVTGDFSLPEFISSYTKILKNGTALASGEFIW